MSEDTTDEILMAAYQAGNQAAFETLFERHAGSVYGFLVRRLGDPTLARDLHQEVFLRVHRARSSYDSARPFRAWLFAIVHNLLTDALRSRRRAPLAAPLDAPGKAEIAEDRPGPERLVAGQESAARLSRVLEGLPADEATVLLLARVEGLPYDQIGEVIGRSPTATRQLAYRALKRVRAGLAAAGLVEEPA